MDSRTRELELLYRTRFNAFCNTIANLVGNDELARDVVQDSFASALRQRSRFRGESSLETWVWRIALNTAARARRGGAQETVNGVEEPAFVDTERDPMLAEALRALSPRRRLVVFLRYFADLSYVEIAAVCGIAEGTVAATLAQAHEALANVLEAEGVPR